MGIITDNVLQETARRAFRERATTLDEAGADIPVADFAATLAALRERIRQVLVDLPDGAYDNQRTGEGEEVWAAGQIAAHLANALQMTRGSVAALRGGMAADLPPRRDLTARPSRDEALAILNESNAELREFLGGISDDEDFARRQQHERFGSMGIKGWLMLTALHEEGHLRQLQALMDSAAEPGR